MYYTPSGVYNSRARATASGERFSRCTPPLSANGSGGAAVRPPTRSDETRPLGPMAAAGHGLWVPLVGLVLAWLPDTGTGCPPHLMGGTAGNPQLAKLRPYGTPAKIHTKREQAPIWPLRDLRTARKLSAVHGNNRECIRLGSAGPEIPLNTFFGKGSYHSSSSLLKWNSDYADYRFTRRNRPRYGEISKRRVRRALSAFKRSFTAAGEGVITRLEACMHLLPKIYIAALATPIGAILISLMADVMDAGIGRYCSHSAILVLFSHSANRSANQVLVTLLMLLCTLPPAMAGRDEDGAPTSRCPIFDGVNSNFVSWLISFTAWLAWKAPELVPILNGSKPPKKPTPADSEKIALAKRKRRREWELQNTQLYGALVSHVSAPIQASLHVQANGKGTEAISYLKQRYGSQSTGDRAEATARLQRSHIDPRAKLCESDIVKQYNEMSLAAADITAAGGTKPDDKLMISMFENALPPVYAMIRQMVRYSKHSLFDDYYNDFLSQVKAEERAAALNAMPGAFAATNSYQENEPTSGTQKGRGGGYRGYGGGRGKGGHANNPCFNCGLANHPRFKCNRPRVSCKFCGANHIDELCPRGPGGKLRDSLSDYARGLLDKQVSRGGNTSGGTNNDRAYSTNREDRNAKRPRSPSTTQEDQRDQAPPSTSAAHGGNAQPRQSQAGAGTSTQQANANAFAANAAPYTELDEFFNNLPRAHVVHDAGRAYASTTHAQRLHRIAFIDSQASSFVVPSSDYLSHVTDANPKGAVHTANGPVNPKQIGSMEISLFSDDGRWHSYKIDGVWVLPECDRVLYSQTEMTRRFGIIHRLDEGYLLLPDGSRKTISKASYTIELSFNAQALPPDPSHAHTASSITIPLPQNITRSDRGADTRASVPQQLLWQRLGFPSRNTWLHIQGVLRDHGLPEAAHLKHDFPVLEAVARARARALPFHSLRDPDTLPAPGALIYMDFAGPMTPSYPHGFTSYCGAIDAGSGYARILPCHSPTKEVAQRCLELLLADLRTLMGLSHKLHPQVVVSDQGSQFMAHYFRDFIIREQAKHWPSTVYKPQQNAMAERMWGTRFGLARSLLKFANLGPAMHPYALQCANWILNRLPQSSRANMSPWFILCRQPASVGYLKSFGCLVRMTIPQARRDGDRHFADRGTLGIYLGPSEQSPGAVLYVPSSRKFYVARDVLCYEDVHPGIKHIESKWPELEDNPNATPLLNEAPSDVQAAAPAPLQLLESAESQPPRDPDVNDPTGTEEHFNININRNPPLSTENQTENDAPDAPEDPPARDDQGEACMHPSAPDSTAGNSDLHPSTAAPKRATPAEENLASDPSSRKFRRVLPQRSTRYQGAYRCEYVDPTQAHAELAIRNAYLLAGETLAARDDLLAYDSAVAGVNGALVVATTSDLGQVLIPRGYKHAKSLPQWPYWRDAINKEYKGLMDINTFEFLRRADVPVHANIMRCHLVFDVKRNSDGSIEKFKARLVADGNTQKYGVDFDRVFSTVAKLSTLRMLLVIAAAEDHNLSSIDIRQAYLQATLREELYMEVPPGMANSDPDGHELVVRLRRSLYGLKQAGREWHILLTDTLKSWGFAQSKIDVCLFTYARGSSRLWIVVWVDDCVIMDSDPVLRAEFVTWLSDRFPVEDKGDLEWVLHIKILRDRPNRSISLSQELYVRDLLERYSYLLDGLTRRFDSPHDASATLTPEQCPSPESAEYAHMQRHREDYMSLIGAYLWLSNVSRIELAYISGQLARFVSNPAMAHYKAALRVLIYLRGTADQVLQYCPSAPSPLRAFVDSDWAVKFSISGGVIEFMGCAILWLSRSQRSVSMSSTEAEYFACCLIAREVIYFRDLTSDFGYDQIRQTTILTDNRGVVALSFDPVAFKKTKHILRAAEFVRDLVLRQVLQLKWISGSLNVADICTKAVSLAVFRNLKSLISRLNDVA